MHNFYYINFIQLYYYHIFKLFFFVYLIITFYFNILKKSFSKDSNQCPYLRQSSHFHCVTYLKNQERLLLLFSKNQKVLIKPLTFFYQNLYLNFKQFTNFEMAPKIVFNMVSIFLLFKIRIQILVKFFWLCFIRFYQTF